MKNINRAVKSVGAKIIHESAETVKEETAKTTIAQIFTEGKSKLDNLQKNLAKKLLPSLPGMPVAKFYDLAIGIDFHPTVLPPSPVFPVPHIGIVYDIMGAIMAAIASQIPSPPPPSEDSPASFVSSLAGIGAALIKGMAPTVKVHGQWIANAGISIQHLPGIIFHALPTVSPMASSEMWMGSATVLADGSPCSTQFHPALSCNIVGIPSIFRKGKPPKPKVSLMAPTSMLVIITSAGMPVLVGGPPTIDLFQLCIKLGLKGLGKLKGKKKPPKTKTPKSKTKAKGKGKGKGKGKKNSKGKGNSKGRSKNKNKPKPKKKCKGEPVDVVTGSVFSENIDFELQGPIPFVWKRYYYSNVENDGPLGFNWTHSYNMGILDEDKEVTIRLSDGRETTLPALLPGESCYDREEQLDWLCDEKGYLLIDSSGLYYRFNGQQDKDGFNMLSEIATQDGFRIQFKYNSYGNLLQITDSREQKLLFDTDVKGHIRTISTYCNDERIDFARYVYDKQGNMIETVDALNVSKYFQYDGHLMVKLTNQSGMSFYWEYKGKRDDARCIHTWGDGGVLEYWLEYQEGMTRTRNGLGHTEEYYYDDNNLIYKIIDANGGITQQVYNENEELEVVVNPEGQSTKSVFNENGKITQYTNENGESTHYTYDDNNNLIRIKTPAGRTLAWKYDEFDRIIERTTPDGECLTYYYEGALLKTITDSRKRNYELSYNKYNDLEKLSYPNGLYRQWKYDRLGNMLSSRDVKGNYTHYQYDESGNLLHLEEPDGNIHAFSYDASGNLIHAKDQLHEVNFTYGPMGVLKVREQNGRYVYFGYDKELQLRKITNERSEEYRFDLDGLGQVVKETGFDGMERKYLRDGAGRVTQVIRPGERWTKYLYDGTGNVVREEHHDETGASYHYNADGLLIEALNEEGLIRFKRDRAGRIVQETCGEHSIQREYDKHGDCIRIGSSLGADIRQQFDEEGKLMKLQAGAAWQADWRRDETGL
ncbi:MAG: DUF6531 domain-containing protein, partial [Candidatus Symbiothrix sp.]|nr:DUF6531 domain-containing protein [Candidatus Symbiothrix sp.]